MRISHFRAYAHAGISTRMRNGDPWQCKILIKKVSINNDSLSSFELQDSQSDLLSNFTAGYFGMDNLLHNITCYMMWMDEKKNLSCDCKRILPNSFKDASGVCLIRGALMSAWWEGSATGANTWCQVQADSITWQRRLHSQVLNIW